MHYYDLQLFQDMDTTFKDEVNQCAQVVTLKKGISPFLQDELLHYFYVVISGVIKTYQINLQTAKEQTIFLLRSGDMLDTVTLLDKKPHDVMYEVLQECQLLKLPIEKVREWMQQPSFNEKFFPYLAKQIRHIESLATDLSLLSTSQRLIKLLLQNLDTHNKAPHNLIHNLSHTELGHLIGTVRHVVDRHLRELKKEDIVDIKRHHIDIKDIDKLLTKLEDS